jgi:hypothetical protein
MAGEDESEGSGDWPEGIEVENLMKIGRRRKGKGGGGEATGEREEDGQLEEGFGVDLGKAGGALASGTCLSNKRQIFLRLPAGSHLLGRQLLLGCMKRTESEARSQSIRHSIISTGDTTRDTGLEEHT